MALTASRCIWCGSMTGIGMFDATGFFKCERCAGRHQTEANGWLGAIEASRVRAVEAEVAEREAMWCLPPA